MTKWVEDNKVLYKNYRKPVANELLMLEMSAMPAGMKRTVLTQEVIRIRRNILFFVELENPFRP